MKIAYAFRRCASYPYNGGELPTDATDRRRFFGTLQKDWIRWHRTSRDEPA